MRVMFRWIILGPLLACALLTGASAAAFADDAAAEGARVTVPHVIRQAADPQLEAWRARLLARHNATSGCYKAHYPDPDWTAVPCVPTRAMNRTPPTLKVGRSTATVRPETVGNFNDYMALSGTRTTSATGAIIELDNLTTESDSGLGSGKYSLQMNTNGFTPPASICSGCIGAVQFYYDQNGGGILVQYWMLNYIAGSVTACPAGWTTAGKSCFKNGSACTDTTKTTSAPAPIVPLADLPQVSLTGQAVAGGNDTVTLAYGRDIVQQSACDNILSLNGNWTATEFNIFGDFNGDVATFNPGVLATVDIALTDTTADFPTCSTVNASSSASTIETTNMDLAQCTQTRPGIRFVEGVRPVIGSLDPRSGSQDGGSQAVITGATGAGGSGFSPSMQASFGTSFVGAECRGNQCTVRPPAGTGSVPVAIENLTSVGDPGPPSSQSVTYQYLSFPFGLLSPDRGNPAGGGAVTLTGHGFDLGAGGTAITFDFPTGAASVGGVHCATIAASGEFTQSCTFTDPALPNPPGSGTVVVPVTATANGRTSGIGGFSYVSPAPPPPTCEDCIDQGERCVIQRGHPVCECERSSPHGVCE